MTHITKLGQKCLLILALAMLTTISYTSQASAQSVGDVYTVQYVPYGGLVDFGSSAVGQGFCIDYNLHAPGTGWNYTVVSPTSTNLSSATRNKVAASLQALSDGFSQIDVNRAIWHFTNGHGASGASGTIISRVNNGTYQPQPVIWLITTSNEMQPMVALLTDPPTPTPTVTPTPTPTQTPTITPTPPPAATPTPIPTASGGGSLWLDADDDGVYVPGTDSTLANVQVELYQSNQNPSQSNALQTVTSDNNGFYQFAPVPNGDYVIYIPNPPADLPLSSSVTDTQDNDEDNDDNGIQSSAGEPVVSPIIRLEAGQEPDTNVDGDGPDSNLTIDFGFTGPGEIIGKAWSDIDRDGIRDAGEPDLDNVTVILRAPNGDEILSTETGSDGSYALPSVPVGEYSLQFITPSNAWWLTIQDQGDDDTLDSDPNPATGFTDAFTIMTGESLVTDAGLVQMQIGGYAWVDADGNGLQDDNESGIDGLTIELIGAGDWVDCANENEFCAFSGTATVRYGANGVYAYKSTSNGIACDNNNFGDPLSGVVKSCSYQDTSTENATVIASVQTDNDGNYVIDSRHLPGGFEPATAYILRSELNQGTLNGRTPTQVNVDNGAPNADEVDSDAIRIDNYAVINFTTGSLELTNYTHDFGFGAFTGRIGGEVWNDLEGTGIQNPAIPKANGVPVTLFNSHGDVVASTETGDNGAYLLGNLPPGDYTLEFQPPTASVWFTLKDQGTDEALDSDVEPDTGFTDVVTVADGAENNNVDAGLIRGSLAYPPRLPSPGDQLSKLGDQSTLLLTAIDDLNDAITYSASNLPPGLSIGETSGQITGTHTATGVYEVSITARDSGGGITTIAFTWTVEELPTITCVSGTQEAENGRLSGGFLRAVTPDGASGAQHIVVPNGTGNEWNGPSGHAAIFCFNVETAGRYRIRGTTKATSGTNDSFYVTVDGSPTDGFLWDVQQSTTYVDDYVNHRGNADPVEVMLSAGQHLVTIYLREDGTQLDKIELELVEAATQAVTCNGLVQEAEAGVPRGNFLTYVDTDASNGLYVAVAYGTGHNFGGAYVQDRIDFCFNVPADGTYILRGTTLADHHYHNSFYVTVNHFPGRGYLWDTAISNSYVEDDMNNRNGSDPVQLFLTAGQHYVRVYLREDGTRLDKLALVAVPTTQAASALADSTLADSTLADSTLADSTPATPAAPAASRLAANRAVENAGEEVNVIGMLDVPSSHPSEPELSGINITITGAGYQEEVTTSHIGKYYIDDVPPGDYTVTAQVPDDNGDMQPLTKAVTVHEASSIDDDDPDVDARTVEAVLEYQPPQVQTNNDLYLPFLSIQ